MGFDYLSIRNEVQQVSLNDLLDQLEVEISRVGQGKPDNAQNLLVKLDAAQQKIDDMVQGKNPVKAETAQFDYLVSELKKNAEAFLQDLGGRAGFLWGSVGLYRDQLVVHPTSRMELKGDSGPVHAWSGARSCHWTYRLSDGGLLLWSSGSGFPLVGLDLSASRRDFGSGRYSALSDPVDGIGCGITLIWNLGLAPTS